MYGVLCMLYVVCCSMLYAVCCSCLLQLYAVCCMLYAVCCMLYAVCCMLYAVCCMLCAVCCMLYAVCSASYCKHTEQHWKIITINSLLDYSIILMNGSTLFLPIKKTYVVKQRCMYLGISLPSRQGCSRIVCSYSLPLQYHPKKCLFQRQRERERERCQL